ncbi:FUSC family protein, partial [Clavibacter michiganensis]
MTSSPAPRPPSTRTLDLEAAMRASVGLLVPLVVLLAIDRLDLALYASFGAFTGLYGRNERYRLRLASVGAGAAMMLVAISTGVLLSLADAPLGLEAVGLAIVLGGASLVSTAMSLVPPHPLFPVFGLVVCAAVPVDGAQARDALVTAVAAILFSAGVCMSGWLLRRWAPDA